MIVALPGLIFFIFLFLFFFFSYVVLFCHCVYLNVSSFGASGSLCFVNVAFPGRLHLYLHISHFEDMGELCSATVTSVTSILPAKVDFPGHNYFDRRPLRFSRC